LIKHTALVMNTHEKLNRQAIAQEWMIDQHHTNPVMLVILIALASLTVGLIPIAYASAFGEQLTQQKAIAAGEAGVWSILGEKSGNSSAARQ